MRTDMGLVLENGVAGRRDDSTASLRAKRSNPVLVRRVGKGALAPCPPLIRGVVLNGGHAHALPTLRCRPRNDGLSVRQDGSLSRKYGSTGPWTFMVSGLPWRSLALPAVTRTQPSLTQYSSTLVFSAPLKRMPTSRAKTSSL